MWMVLVARGCTWKDRRAAQVGLKSMAMRVVPGMHSRARRSVVHVAHRRALAQGIHFEAGLALQRRRMGSQVAVGHAGLRIRLRRGWELRKDRASEIRLGCHEHTASSTRQ